MVFMEGDLNGHVGNDKRDCEGLNCKLESGRDTQEFKSFKLSHINREYMHFNSVMLREQLVNMINM
uniref:Uncharacterized protein n=1 Tax=Rhizophora mucronata TaxID=61149 RepID=A0A2P2QND4_RHIMU